MMAAIGRHLLLFIILIGAVKAVAEEDGHSLVIPPQKLSVEASESKSSSGNEDSADIDEEFEAALLESVENDRKEDKSSTEREARNDDEIPVLTGSTDKKQISGNSYLRMVGSLAVVLLTALGMVFFARWWKRKYNVHADETKIRVLAQHHLGPKKNLSIIQVAGESILIGVTEHNINHIRTLSLIDDEVPEDVPERFPVTDAEVDAESAAPLAQDEPVKDRVSMTSGPEENMTTIKQKISERLKEMRPL